MLSLEIIKNNVHRLELNHSERLLISMAISDQPQSTSEIKETVKRVGLGSSIQRNIASYLNSQKKKGKVLKSPDGWELTKAGRDMVLDKLEEEIDLPKITLANDLRKQLQNIKDVNTKNFLDEALKCYELKLYRAAVVLSWVGAMSLLYDYVIEHKLSDFNKEAKRRDAKWRTAKSKDDLSRMKEYDFLQVLVSLSVIGKNVKEELEGCLKLRNACGHPNSLKIGNSRVSAHLEVLLLNVFAHF